MKARELWIGWPDAETAEIISTEDISKHGSRGAKLFREVLPTDQSYEAFRAESDEMIMKLQAKLAIAVDLIKSCHGCWETKDDIHPIDKFLESIKGES